MLMRILGVILLLSAGIAVRRCHPHLFVRRAGDWADRSASGFTRFRTAVGAAKTHIRDYRFLFALPMIVGGRCGPFRAAVV